MKKLLLLSALFASLNLAAMAQTEKGTWMFGASLANLDYTFKSEVFSLNLEPQVGYFVSDNFAVGAKGMLGIISANSETTTIYGIGPFARGYFGGNEKRKFFAQGDVGFSGVSFSDSDTNSSQFNLGASVGHAWFLTKNVALEGAVGYSFVKEKDTDGESGLGLRFGFQIHLPGKTTSTE